MDGAGRFSLTISRCRNQEVEGKSTTGEDAKREP